MKHCIIACALLSLFNGMVVAQERANKKVLILGIDGCRTDAFLAAEAPNLHALKNDGAFSDNNDILGSRDTGADTVTGPGWSSALTGVWADKHGVKDNAFQGSNANEYPTFFRRVQESHPNAECAAYVSWTPFSDHLFSESENCRLPPNVDVETYATADEWVADAAAKYLATEDPEAIFVYFGNVDSAGHEYGFHPNVDQYAASITEVDAHIGHVLKAVRNRTTFAKEDWLIMVCTDHGGRGTGHSGGQSDPQVRSTFLILNGPSVVEGVIKDKTANVDVAVTALSHLGVAIKPEWKLDGHAVGLIELKR